MEGKELRLGAAHATFSLLLNVPPLSAQLAPPPSAPPFPTLQPKSITREAEKSKREREKNVERGEKREKRTKKKKTI
jgi:hypothetical protein